ncbi:MAG: hypothetical protein HN405_07955, partial [Planctomycetes bacterium]|nr:hypothetical protein [Planctomycetota bacterium]
MKNALLFLLAASLLPQALWGQDGGYPVDLWQVDGTQDDECLGYSLTPTQDLDADGVDDVF